VISWRIFRKHANLPHVVGNGHPRLPYYNGCWQARKDSKKISLPDKAGERLAVKKHAVFKKKMAKRKDRREVATTQATLQGPLTKEDSLSEV
jgi:hypothetical protein